MTDNDEYNRANEEYFAGPPEAKHPISRKVIMDIEAELGEVHYCEMNCAKEEKPAITVITTPHSSDDMFAAMAALAAQTDINIVTIPVDRGPEGIFDIKPEDLARDLIERRLSIAPRGYSKSWLNAAADIIIAGETYTQTAGILVEYQTMKAKRTGKNTAMSATYGTDRKSKSTVPDTDIVAWNKAVDARKALKKGKR